MIIIDKIRAWIILLSKQTSRRNKVIVASLLSAILLVILLLIFIPRNSSEALNFAPYTSNQGAFSVEAPDGRMDFSSANWSFLDKKTTRFAHLATLPAGTFAVIHFDMPPGVISPSDRTSIFNTLITSFLEEFNGVMEQSQTFDIHGNPGMSAVATGMVHDKVIAGEVMVVMVANRVYIIGAYGDKKELRNKYIHHFLNSFTFNF